MVVPGSSYIVPWTLLSGNRFQSIYQNLPSFAGRRGRPQVASRKSLEEMGIGPGQGVDTIGGTAESMDSKYQGGMNGK